MTFVNGRRKEGKRMQDGKKGEEKGQWEGKTTLALAKLSFYLRDWKCHGKFLVGVCFLQNNA